MTQTFFLQCGLIGACTALIIRLIVFLIQKQPRNTLLRPLLKTGLSGALLGCAGGWIGYLTASWVSGFSQHWLVLLLSAYLAAFIVGWVLPLGYARGKRLLLERLVWHRLGWGN